MPVPWYASTQALELQGRNGSAPAPGQRSLLVADAFLSGSCVVFVSVEDCEWPLAWRSLELGVSAAQGSSGASLLAAPLPRGRPTQLKLRDAWEWTVEGRLCHASLAAAETATVTFYHGELSSPALRLVRAAALPAPAPLAMMLTFRSDVRLTPLWLNAWAALGVGHFYLYFNGVGLREGLRREAGEALLAALEADPRVTLAEWPFPMWQGGGAYRDFSPKGCAGHFAQMMAFNAAFQRFGARHEYMGFFDFDELPILRAHAAPAALASGNALLHLLTAAGRPLALAFMNRWGGLQPALPPPTPDSADPWLLSPDRALAYSFFGGATLTGRSRSKYFVRTTGFPPDSLLGNHDVFRIQQQATREAAAGAAGGELVEVRWGNGYESEANAQATRLEGPAAEAYFLHVLNVRPAHQSSLPFDPEEAVAGMVANNSRVEEMTDLIWAARVASSAPERGILVALAEELRSDDALEELEPRRGDEGRRG